MKVFLKNKKYVLLSLFIYLIVLIWIIAFKMNMKQAIFECMYTFSKCSIGQRFNVAINSFNLVKGLANLDFYVNILLFIPLGFYTIILFERRSFIIGFIFSSFLTLSFEIIQLFTAIGFYSFLDIISNILGFILGYIIFIYLKRIIKDNILNRFFIIFTILLILIASYGIINTIINIDIYSLSSYTRRVLWRSY